MSVTLKDLSAHIRASKGERIWIHGNTARQLYSYPSQREQMQEGKEIGIAYPCRAIMGFVKGYGYYVRRVSHSIHQQDRSF